MPAVRSSLQDECAKKSPHPCKRTRAVHFVNHLLQHTDIRVPVNGGKPSAPTVIQPETLK